MWSFILINLFMAGFQCKYILFCFWISNVCIVDSNLRKFQNLVVTRVNLSVTFWLTLLNHWNWVYSGPIAYRYKVCGIWELSDSLNSVLCSVPKHIWIIRMEYRFSVWFLHYQFMHSCLGVKRPILFFFISSIQPCFNYTVLPAGSTLGKILPIFIDF